MSCQAKLARRLFHSSARAELAGLVTGLLAPTAVHIGLDNMGVTQKGAAILGGTISRRRPWSLKPDGDLWCLVDSLIQQRSTNATYLDWIKGHVSLQLLDQGYSVRDAVLNSCADAAADAAHRIGTMKLQHEILNFFGRKQHEMVGILTAILRRIARVAKLLTTSLLSWPRSALSLTSRRPCFHTRIAPQVLAYPSSTLSPSYWMMLKLCP